MLSGWVGVVAGRWRGLQRTDSWAVAHLMSDVMVVAEVDFGKNQVACHY